jgi:hypothetical protein
MKFIALTLASLAAAVSADQHFTVGIQVGIDGASGDPNDAKCTHVLETTMVDAYAAVYPGQDTHLDAVHFDKVSPGIMLGVGTTGRWDYYGDGTSCLDRVVFDRFALDCRRVVVSHSNLSHTLFIHSFTHNR